MKTEEQVRMYYQKKAKDAVDKMFRHKIFNEKYSERSSLHGVEDLISFMLWNADATGRLASKNLTPPKPLHK